jgi:large subunit ribosomal protein L30
MGALLVVNLKGMVNVREKVRRTLKLLKVDRRFRATLVPDTPDYRGMLTLAKDRLAWSPAPVELVERLLKERGRVRGLRPLTEEEVKRLGYDSHRSLAEALVEGRVRLKDLDGVKPCFALSPPKGGFKASTRRMFQQGGVLGENPELPSLVERMI